MTIEDDPRDAAIKRYNDRAARDQQEAAKRQRERDAKARQQEQNLAAWPAASNAIYHGVNAANDDFAPPLPVCHLSGPNHCAGHRRLRDQAQRPVELRGLVHVRLGWRRRGSDHD